MKQGAKLLFGLILLFNNWVFGQMDQYEYQRRVTGITDQWHQITLPEAMYGQIQSDFADIRIFGITAANDTIEAPYLLDVGMATTKKVTADFEVINQSRTKDGYYLTFRLTNNISINQIDLDFETVNFDWQTRLEGSHNQQNWFTILDNYRIVSMRNELTNYQFTTLNFSKANYTYYRLLIKTSDKVNFQKATLDLSEKVLPKYQAYPIIHQEISNNRKKKRNTLVEFEIANIAPVSYVAVETPKDFDFYRPIFIQYVVDSLQLANGWRYYHRTHEKSVLSSLESNEFSFSSKIARKWRVVISNQDNPPLKINGVKVKGYQHQLTARFTEPADYFLTYGREKAIKPRYDIARFQDKIPSNLTTLTLGNEQFIGEEETANTPFFQNKWWLWGLMLVIIAVLGWFSLKMLRET